MPDFHDAGGVPTLLRQLAPTLHLEHRGVSGRPLGDLLRQERSPVGQTVIAPLERPVGPPGALAVLRGSLAPDGALIKAAAASPELLVHQGPALVFDSPQDAAQRIDDPALAPTPAHVLVLRNAGPIAAGMPEAGSLRIPKTLAAQGVRDMVRISDGRMSGTAFGTVVLHCCPESAAGGPLALVRNGDPIRLDLPARRLDLLVDDAELELRRSTWQPPPLPERGWRRLYAEHVLPASEGADLDFLIPQARATNGTELRTP
jgi:dihydroxy-acid dehydratase